MTQEELLPFKNLTFRIQGFVNHVKRNNMYYDFMNNDWRENGISYIQEGYDITKSFILLDAKKQINDDEYYWINSTLNIIAYEILEMMFNNKTNTPNNLHNYYSLLIDLRNNIIQKGL